MKTNKSATTMSTELTNTPESKVSTINPVHTYDKGQLNQRTPCC